LARAFQQGGTVIARIWHGWTKPEDADGYEAHLKPELLPGLSKVKGFQGSYLLRRAVGDEIEFVTIILWDSIEAVRAVAGEDYETAVIPEERRKYLKRFDANAAHFEVVSEGKPG
jgi:heme-degrading monooxygenase HmoA